MKNEKPNAELVWKQFEDLVAPQLKLSAVDHAVYSHLLRHSRLEGKRRLHLSMNRLGRGTRHAPLRRGRTECGAPPGGERRAAAGGTQQSGTRDRGAAAGRDARGEDEARGGKLVRRDEHPEPGVEKGNFWKDKAVRQAIHRREGGACFYCLRRVKARLRCIDHVVPQVRCGPSSYRNLVSSCGDCNAQKGEEDAGNFLRKLYREEKLTQEELNGRLRALKELVAGKLRPEIETRVATECRRYKRARAATMAERRQSRTLVSAKGTRILHA
jgi:hypothetical protein